MRTYNVLAHLFLNVIGTFVLGASNYLQQISTSPTAQQIDCLQGNINFGSNLPGELLKRKGWHMKLFWTLLISNSVQIPVILNEVLGIETDEIDDTQCRIGCRWAVTTALSGILVFKTVIVYYFLRRIKRTLQREHLFNSIGDFIVLGASKATPYLDSHRSRLPGQARQTRFRWISTLGPGDFLIWLVH